MNPVIVIPSYWAKTDQLTEIGEVGVYDHATPITKPLPELETCLDSLEQVRGVLRVVVLLVAPPVHAEAARARVDGICRMHPALNPLVVGQEEAQEIVSVVEQAAPTMEGEPCSLRGYGAIRNMGLAVAAALGHDIVVFLDDDEVVLDENFLIDAVYGIGLETRQGLPIQAKSGYFINRAGSSLADESQERWCDRWWPKRAEFNSWMRGALEAPRISRSNYVCGGCFAVGAQAFTSVAFDPQITRGEDLDYLFDLRMHGFDVWFDNQWVVQHMPPHMPSRASRFLQNVYRWEYEVAKLEAARQILDLRHVTPASLHPYPEHWIDPKKLRERIFRTTLARTIAGPERRAYFDVLVHGIKEARSWAASAASDYFAFQTFWPRIMITLWEHPTLSESLLRTGTPREISRPAHAAAPSGLDDALPLVGGDW